MFCFKIIVYVCLTGSKQTTLQSQRVIIKKHIMKTIKSVAILMLSLLLTNCSVTKTVKSNGITVPAGTEVAFGKISNENFAENYIDADVIVNCVFLSSQSTASFTTKKPPKGHFAFQVTSEDVNPTKNELTGALEGLVVFAPLEYSDLVFGLKRGEKLQLRGGTLVTKAALSLYSINNRYVHFVATDITKR